jgi:cytochrome c oxidase assembly factor CtaG
MLTRRQKKEQQNSLQEEGSLRRRAIPAIAVALSLLSLVAASTSDLLEFSASNLAFHMTVEHMIFFVTGALFAEVIGRLLKPARRLMLSLRLRYVAICLVVSAVILVIWHYPPLFAAASFHDELHQFQHASFIVTGAIAYVALRSMTLSYLILFVILMGAVMAMVGALLLVSNEQIFFPYSIESHSEAGSTMIILTIVMAVVLLPAILISHSLRHELRRQ